MTVWDFDAIIIGAGVIGTATALAMARRGFKTLNVDALPAAGYGHTSNSDAIIRTYYSTLDGTALAYDGYFHWKNWNDYLGVTDERGMISFRECGSVVIKTAALGQMELLQEHSDSLGIPYEHWTVGQLTARLPGFDTRLYHPPKQMQDEDFAIPTGASIDGGLYFPRSGFVNDPQLAAHNLQIAAEAAGGRFLFNAKVMEIPVHDNRVTGVVLADGKQITAPVVLNISGPHSGKVNALVGAERDMTVGTRALRHEVVHVLPPEDMDWQRDGIIMADNDVGCYMKPDTGPDMVVGTTDPKEDKPEAVDPDDYDDNLGDKAMLYAYRMAQRFSELRVPSHPVGVVGLYDQSDDWIPIYDRSCIDGYYMAIGTSGNQFKNAPVVGRLMAELVSYVEDGGDQDNEPLQYQLHYVDHSLSTATFSRKRAIHANSSFSVLG